MIVIKYCEATFFTIIRDSYNVIGPFNQDFMCHRLGNHEKRDTFFIELDDERLFSSADDLT